MMQITIVHDSPKGEIKNRERSIRIKNKCLVNSVKIIQTFETCAISLSFPLKLQIFLLFHIFPVTNTAVRLKMYENSWYKPGQHRSARWLIRNSETNRLPVYFTRYTLRTYIHTYICRCSKDISLWYYHRFVT